MRLGFIIMYNVAESVKLLYNAFRRKDIEIELFPVCAKEVWDDTRSRLEKFDGDLIFSWQGIGCPPELLADKKMPKIIWTFDDPRRFTSNRQPEILMAHDVILTCDAGCVTKYRALGKKSEWFPPAADAELGRNAKTKTDYCADISFVGQGHRLSEFDTALLDRSTLMRKVLERFPGKSVKIWTRQASSWDDIPPEIFQGPVLYDDALSVFAHSKINLNAHCSFHNADRYCNERIVLAMSAGGFVLCDKVPGLKNWLTKGVMFYSSIDECLDKIQYYLSHERERRLIASQGQKFILDNWTYDHFVEKLLPLVKQ